MNWMDYEASLNERLNRLEIKSQIVDHIVNRLRYLTDLKTKNEYEYTELLGRINELELFLTYFKTITTTNNE
jgi:vacuolar-type H+-ATPase subunit E/Vma4